MRAMAVAVVVLLVSGCVNGVKQCAQSDCPGGRCETSTGICMQVDGGAGGVGGGGGSAGGGGGAGGGTVVMCTPACNGWEACRSDAGCESLLTGLAFTTPAMDFLTKTASQPYTATFVPAGLTAYPPNISVGLTRPDGGMVAPVMVGGTGNAYSSMALLSEEGPNKLTATYGPLTGARTITFDVTAPSVATIVATAPADAGCSMNVECGDFTTAGVFYKKDETLFLGALFQTADFDKSTVSLKLAGQGMATNTKTFGDADRVAETNCGGCAPASQCACFKVDLPGVPLNGLNEKFNVEVSGAKDDAGNVMPVTFTSDAGNPIGVTRVRWRRTLAAGAGYPKAAPAVGRDGTVYVGTSTGISGIKADGTDKWPAVATAATIDSSPAVGAFDGGVEYVFFAGNNALGPVLGSLSASTGMLSSGLCAGDMSASTTAALALSELSYTGQPRLAATALMNRPGASLGYLASHLAPQGAGSAKCQAKGFDFDAPNAPTAGTAAVVAKGLKAYWGTEGGQLRGVDYLVGPDNWEPLDGGLQIQLPGVGELWGVALWQNGTHVAGGGLGVGRVFDVQVVGGDGGVQWSFPSSGARPVGGPAVTGGSAVYGLHTPGTGVEKTIIGAATATTTTPLSGQVKTTPVLGEGGEIYVLHANGGLSVTDSALSFKWMAPALTGANVIASPNLDCNRTSTTLMQSGPGVLYLASPGGHLISILVDSPKLSTTAEWPKWQHDAQNSGNPDFQRNAGCQ